MSINVPQLEYDAFASLMSLAPTVIAFSAAAGLLETAFRLELPAAIEEITPISANAWTAKTSESVEQLPTQPPPKDIDTTDFAALPWLKCLCLTTSSAVTIPEVEPLPASLRIFMP